MKKSILIIHVFFILNVDLSLAQTRTKGIYLNREDFLNKKITHAGKHTQLKLHELSGKDHLEVKYNDSTFFYLKKDVFGYIDKDGQTYRFFNNAIYPILNPDEKILLYEKTSGTGLRNSPVSETYFFSKEAGTEILPLTLINLEQIFSGNKVFTNVLEIYFKNDNDLTEYDSIHKMYKLNRLFELTKNKALN